MTNKQLSREGYEISGPVSVKNPAGRLMEAYQVRRLADGAELNLKFSATTRQDRCLEVCSAKPAKGWVIPEYDGCTFMALKRGRRLAAKMRATATPSVASAPRP